MSDTNKSLARAVTSEFNRRLSARFKEAVKNKTVASFDAEAAKQETIDDVFGVVREILDSANGVDSEATDE